MSDDEMLEIAKTARDAYPHGWWQKSWMCETAPHPESRELSELLCFFADEDAPRFWDYPIAGKFVATFDPPTVYRLLKRIAELEAKNGIA